MRRLPARGVLWAAALVGTFAATAPSWADLSPAAFNRARQLVTRADALFALQRPRDALDLLARALALQTHDGASYGYARYVRFRRAKHLFSRGNTRGARVELLRALSITLHQDRVDPPYRVARHHPFIVRNFPLVAGISMHRQPLHSVAKGTTLTGEHGPFVYVHGPNSVYRLHRLRRTVLDLHHVTEDGRRTREAIVGIAVSPNGNLVAIAQRNENRVRLLSFAPVQERTVGLPLPPHALRLNDDGVLLSFSFTNRNAIRVHRLAPLASRPPALIYKSRGEILLARRDGLLYAAPSRSGKAAPAQRSLQYEHIAFRRFDPPRERRLISFARPDPRTRATAIAGRQGKRVVVFVRNAARNERRILVYDPRTDRIHDHVHRGILAFPREPAGCLSFNEDFLVILQRRRARVALIRFSLETGQTSLLAALPPSSSPVFALGVLADNETVWLHRGDELVLVRTGGHTRTVKLPPFTKVSRPRWTGSSYYFAAPEQFFFGWEPRTPKHTADPRFLLLARP